MDATRRAKSHHDDIESEQPMFIQPALEDPSLLLEFREEYLYAIDGNVRGKVTIEALGLNREKLVELRRDILGPIKVLLNCRELFAIELAKGPHPEFTDQLAAIDARLVQLASDRAQYAMMVRAIL
jgi:hypothetical protein